MSTVVPINAETRLTQMIHIAQLMATVAPIVGPFHVFLNGEKKKDVIGTTWKKNPGWVDPEEIDLKLRKTPGHFNGKQPTGYGLRTNKLFVLDFDGPEGMATYEKLKAELSPTLRIRTQSGGIHLVYRYSGEETLKTDCKKTTFPGTDIKCGEGILFGPGSWVEGGGEYSIIDDIPAVEVDGWVLDKYQETQKSAPTETPQSGRNTSMISKVGVWLSMGLSNNDLMDLAREANAKFNQPLPEDEITGLVRSAAKRYGSGSMLQDWYLAKAIAEMYEDDIRYCLEERQIYVKGKTRWEPDPTHGLLTKLINTARSKWIAEASRSPDRAKTLIKRLLDLGNVSKRKNVIEDLQRQIEIHIRASEKDNDALVVGCQNGWIEFRGDKAVFHDGCPEALVTKSLNAEFNPEAECPIWMAALEVWFPDEDVREFVQRVAGYILAGGNEREVLFFLQGPAASGKTKFTSTLLHILGDYGIAIRVETITDKRRSAAGASEDLARMAGVRLAVTDEPAQGMRFNEALVKSLAGRDRINARGLYQKSFDFDARMVLVIHSNFDLRASADDPGFWRRMLKIPFVTKIKPKDRDPKLLKKLKAESDGILRWAISGWTEYQRQGLAVPDSIRKASRKYRESQGLVSEFLDEYCETGDAKSIKPRELHEKFCVWCRKYQINRPMRPRRFDQEIMARGFIEDFDEKKSRVWKGIDLTDEAKAKVDAPF